MGSYRNLIGEPIKNDAVLQLKARANLLASVGYQNDDATIYKARANNAFVKLTSFVKVTDSKLADAVGDGGIELARKWSLFNGINTGNGSAYNYSDKRSGTNLKGYGQGGTTELGIRPMPGITSVTISPAGMAGSVRRAEIKFRCHNLAQLDIIDVLYFRFGFSMLLEWGHTMYTNNAGKIVIENTPIDIFGNNWSKEELLKELAKRRRSTDGNYDGMLGIVTNYEWNMTPDGGYDCTLKLTGIGGVIESLKINGTESQPSLESFVYTPGQGPKAPPNPSGVPIPGAALGAINKAIGVVDSAQKVSDAYSSTLTTAMSVLKQIVKSTTTMSDFRSGLQRVFSPGIGLYADASKVSGYDHGFNAAYMSGIDHSKVKPVNFASVYSFAFWSFEGTSADSSTPQTMDMVYIPLGLLLAIMNNSCLAYDRQGSKSRPFVYIDFHPETNLCFRLPDQFSVDPSICLLDNTDIGNKGYINWLKRKGVDVNSMSPGVPSYDSTNLQNALHQRLKASGIPGYQAEIETVGRIMNILVNVDFVIATLSQMAGSDEKQSVYLSQFLSTIMTNIAKVTGNINNFQVVYDDESNVVRIVDEQLVHGDDTVVYPQLPVFGLDSVMKSMSFKTEASTKIGSMLAIEAMAGERTPTTDGRDGSAFSALNSRIEDRLITERTRRAADNPAAPDTKGVTARAGIFNSYKWQLYNDSKFNKENSSNNVNFYAECMNAMKADISTENGIKGTNPSSTTARGVLPLSINLTLGGISNIMTREGFVIPYDRLPSQYKIGTATRVGFVIADLTHTIQGQTWNTAIRGQMINLPNNQVTQKSGTYIITKTVTPPGSFGKVAVIVGTPPTSVSNLGFGAPLANGFIVSSFLFRNKSKTRGVAPTSGPDGDHYGYDMVGPNGGNRNDALSAQVGGKGTNGDIIYSVFDGVVYKAGPASGFGYSVVVDMDINGQNYTAVYGHVPPSGISVVAGQTVSKGTALAYMGTEGHSTGYHLHFEIWKGKKYREKVCSLMDPGDMFPLFVADGGKAPGTVLKDHVKVG